MKNLIVNGVKFYPIDKDNEIEIEREGWSFWLSIEETKKVIEFLTKQVEEPKQETLELKRSNMKQTALDFLIEKLDNNLDIKHSWRTKQYIEQAKEMEKEQIIDARDALFHGTPEQYYKETFKSE
jgi:hypothetical protein